MAKVISFYVKQPVEFRHSVNTSFFLLVKCICLFVVVFIYFINDSC